MSLSPIGTKRKYDIEWLNKHADRLATKGQCIRYKVLAVFSGLPKDIASIIVDYLRIYKLLSWISSLDKLDFISIRANPNAFLAGYISDFDEIPSDNYAIANPFAIDHIKRWADLILTCTGKWENPKVVEWLFPAGIYPITREALIHLGYCKSMLAVDWLLNNVPKKDAIGYLSSNHLAIDILRQNMDLVDKEHLWANSAAVDILQSWIAAGDPINWTWLSWNSSDWAMDLLSKNQDKIDWSMLSENPGIFKIADNKSKKSLMKILTGNDAVESDDSIFDYSIVRI